MIKLTSKHGIDLLPRSVVKTVMGAVVENLCNQMKEPSFDPLSDSCPFYMLQFFDDIHNFPLYEGKTVDLTDFDEMNYEFVQKHGHIYHFYWVTGDEGGPSFFIEEDMFKNEPEEVRAKLAALAASYGY